MHEMGLERVVFSVRCTPVAALRGACSPQIRVISLGSAAAPGNAGTHF